MFPMPCWGELEKCLHWETAETKARGPGERWERTLLDRRVDTNEPLESDEAMSN